MATPSVFKQIKSNDITVKPFKAYKNWTVTNTDYSSSGYVALQAIHTTEKTPIGSVESANDPTNSFDGSYQAVVWKSLDHMYYRFPYDPARTNELCNREKVTKFLFVSASTVAFPYLKTGEQVKPGSVIIASSGSYGVCTLYDDTNGNICDSDINTSSFAPKKHLVAYWGFNNEFRRFRFSQGNSNTQELFFYNSTNVGNIEENKIEFESNAFTPEFKSDIKNVSFKPGMIFYDPAYGSVNTGLQAEFTGDGYIVTDNHDSYNFGHCDEFAISCWVQLPISQSVTSSNENYIVSKRGVVGELVYDKTTAKIATYELNKPYANFPFQIAVYNQSATNGKARKLVCKRSDGINTTELTSSAVISSTQHTHILYQKTGSNMQLYINGTLNGTVTDTVNGSVSNTAKLIFAAMNKSGSYGLSGSLDEVRIYNTALTQDQISSLSNYNYLSGSAYQTNVVGNVFYKFGQCVVSSVIPKYQEIFAPTQDYWNVKYRSTHTVYEHETFLTVPMDTFNVTMNPTATYKLPAGTSAHCNDSVAPEPGDAILPDFTGSLRPYITSIGLYNENGELLVIGKLAQAIQKRDDVDMNFIIRYDI
jgi:hypothetical protein